MMRRGGRKSGFRKLRNDEEGKQEEEEQVQSFERFRVLRGSEF